MFAAEIRKRRVARMRNYPQWCWHLDEVFVRVNGKLCYLWRAVDHEGEVLEGRHRWALLVFCGDE
jgi:putative transposase